MPTCTDLIRGSFYSRKGGNRYDPCHHEALFHVISATTGLEWDVCRMHVRKFRRTNEMLWRTDDYFKRPRRMFYEITELAEAKT